MTRAKARAIAEERNAREGRQVWTAVYQLDGGWAVAPFPIRGDEASGRVVAHHPAPEAVIPHKSQTLADVTRPMGPLERMSHLLSVMLIRSIDFALAPLALVAATVLWITIAALVAPHPSHTLRTAAAIVSSFCAGVGLSMVRGSLLRAMRLASEDPRGFERFTGDQAFLRRWWFAAGALIAALGVLGVLLASR